MSPERPAGLLVRVQHALQGIARWSRLPRLDVTVETAPPAGGATDPAVLTARAAATVSAVLERRMAELRVPGRAAVRIRLVDGPETPRLSIGGCPCRTPDARLAEAMALIPAPQRVSDGVPADWLARLEAVCHVAVEWDPGILVGPDQVAAMVAAARDAGVVGHADDVLGRALAATVRHGVSCGEPSALARELREHEGVVSTDAEIAEVLIAGLAPDRFRVALAERTLREMTTGEVDTAAFTSMRVRIFNELGLHLPDLDIDVDPDLPEGRCVVRLHHVTFRPEPIPAPPTVEALAAAVEARVREHPWWFVDVGDVHDTVEQIRLALPELVGAVTERYTDVKLALLARALLVEAVPLRNAARLMVLVLDVPEPGSGGRDMVRLAEPHRSESGRAAPLATPGNLVTYARQQILEEATRADSGLREVEVAWVPDGLVDVRTAAAGAGDRVEPPEGFLGTLFEHAARAVASDWGLVSTSQPERDTIQRLLEGQYPDVPVRCSGEFPPSYRLGPPPSLV